MRWELLQYVWAKAVADIRNELRGYRLGFLWWYLEPLLYLVAFYFVFATGLRGRGPEYLSFLLVGLTGWKWFAATVQRGIRWSKGVNGIIQNMYVPKLVFPVIGFITSTLKFLLMVVLVAGYLWLFEGLGGAGWIRILPVILAQAVLIMGIVMLAGALVPFLPDLRLALDNLILLLFFVSGIFFDIAEMSPEAQSILRLNPLVGVIEAYRAVLLGTGVFDPSTLLYPAVFGAVALVIGLWLFVRFDRQYPKYQRF